MTRRLKAGATVLTVIALTAGGAIWLRDSSLVAVTNVQISGITASDGDQVAQALTSAAKGMTTLHVREQALRDAVKPYVSVGDVAATKDFPHTLRVRVIERRPVAAVATDNAPTKRTPVTGGGLVLRGVSADRGLPSVFVNAEPAGERITDKKILNALKVAAEAPEPLLYKTDELAIDDRGVIAALHNGPELVFGTGEHASQKWAAAARVLAEISAQGATYLDLRIPGRVAAGGLAPVATPTVDPNPQPEAENSPTLDP
jgi:cell division protein FtsQ